VHATDRVWRLAVTGETSMAANIPEPYFDTVSEGICEVANCSSPAKYRAWWAQGVIIRLVCTTHKAEVEGKLFEELSPSTFKKKRMRSKDSK
jgi:hypothetical protein